MSNPISTRIKRVQSMTREQLEKVIKSGSLSSAAAKFELQRREAKK